MSTTKVSPTQRAYTLRLALAESGDIALRHRLWRTHAAVNQGAAAFGDWLLTLRGGLDHRLAELPVKEKAGERPPNAEERRDRRILLALSWLTVEAGYIGPHAVPAAQVVATLREILRQRGLTEAEARDWETDCGDSLRATIKDGATWVNRSAAFDAATEQLGPSLTREEVWDLLLPFFGSISSYLEPVAMEGDEASGEEKAKDLVQKAGQWLSSRFGTGQGADFTRLARVYEAMNQVASGATAPIGKEAFFTLLAQGLSEFAPAAPTPEAILSLISGPGYKSATRNLVKAFRTQAALSAEDLAKFAQTSAEDAEASRGKTGGKGHRAWSDRLLAQVEAACGFTYLGALKHDQRVGDDAAEREAARHSEFAVMLDHAARRVSLAHTWAKRAEAERRQFTCEAAKLPPLRAQHPAAVEWLDAFCARRSASSHAEDAYRIRPRAVEGWKEVVAAWRKPECVTEGDRIEAARALQDSDQIEKFGDIQLFEALAEDEARCVWESGHDLLLSYAKATDAQHKKQRFKVPAYCHPDPLRHPVFCDFGNSRWDVAYALHEATHKERNALLKAQKELGQAKTEEEKSEAMPRVTKAQMALEVVVAGLLKAWKANPQVLQRISMKLFDGNTIQETSLKWQSRRLIEELGLDEDWSETRRSVSRVTSQSKAAAGSASGEQSVATALHEMKDWNGRLQAPREQLDALAAHLEKHGLPLHDEARWDERARRLRDNLAWLVTFSAKLQPQGPWQRFIEHCADQAPFQRTVRESKGARKMGEKFLSVEGWPHDEINNPLKLNEEGDKLVADSSAKRGDRAQLILSRLPGLRLLSADLGHRFGAACAVWETLSPEQFEQECAKARAGGATVNIQPLFAQFLWPGRRSHASHKEFTPITFFRRIGSDQLPDGKPHPAPWARLDRQFLIKLQGEEAAARKVSPVELDLVDELEAACGLAPEFRLKQRLADARRGEDRRPSLEVDDVMSAAVDTLRLALKRHATRARLARDFAATHRLEPGDRKAEQPMTADQLAEHLTRALLVWHDLKSSRRSPDADADALWAQHVAPRLGGRELEQRPEEREAAATRRDRDQRNAAKLADLAAALSPTERDAISRAWAEVWQKHDAAFRPLLGRVRDWLRPRGLRRTNRETRIASRRTGGLSLNRLATLRSFYQVQKAFFTRLRPDGTHPTAEESFGQRSLDALERLREQRVKQLASRLAAAALGLAPAAPTPDERGAQGKEAVRAARMRLSKLAPRFVPCHAVVIESLANYRPDQLQTRRENRQLMQWSSRKVQKHLAEACQLHGLHLREVPPAYTSRQDSRTGAPGLRCVDVPLKEFLREGGFWQRDVEKVRRKNDRERKAAEQLLLDTFDSWKNFAAHPTPDQARRLAHGSIRLMRDGGDIFVSASRSSPVARGLQADLNAAANIGLKALLDPDWEGSWWSVLCEVRNDGAMEQFIAHAKSVKGCPLFSSGTPLRETAAPVSKPNRGKAKAAAVTGESPAAETSEEKKKPVNLWRTPVAASITPSDWQPYQAYWDSVRGGVISVLRTHNGLSAAAPKPEPPPVDDDVSW